LHHPSSKKSKVIKIQQWQSIGNVLWNTQNTREATSRNPFDSTDVHIPLLASVHIPLLASMLYTKAQWLTETCNLVLSQYGLHYIHVWTCPPSCSWCYEWQRHGESHTGNFLQSTRYPSYCFYQTIITHRQYTVTLSKVDSTLCGQSIGEGQTP
jgi:hypothetical protein